MKKLFLLALALTLTACATRPFDPVEYNYAVESAVLSTRAIHQCQQKGEGFEKFVSELNTQTMKLFEYEKHHSHNDQSLTGVMVLRQLVIDFNLSHGVKTPTYCVHKLSEIQSASRALAITLSGATSLELCQSDATERLAAYDQSLVLSKITKLEHAELTKDLAKLVRADNAYCTAEQKDALAEAVSLISAAIGALK